MEPRGLFLFLGPDRPRKLQRIQELARALKIGPLDRHDLDGAVIPAADLLALCRQQPAASTARLIVLDHANRLDAEAVSALVHHAGTIAQTACVVLLVERELGVRHPLSRAVHEGLIQLTRFVGRDAPAARPFALVDALGSRDVAGCLQALREQLMLGKDVTEVIGLVTWQVQRWTLVRRLLDAGYPAQRIAEVAGLHAWQVERGRAEVSGRSADSLHHSLERCWQLDADVKRGRTLPWLALEQLLIELCLAGNTQAISA